MTDPLDILISGVERLLNEARREAFVEGAGFAADKYEMHADLKANWAFDEARRRWPDAGKREG